MENMNDIVKLAIDGYNGSVEKYSVGQSQEAIRNMLIEANGGNTKLDYRKIRGGECNKLFAYIEEILGRVIPESLENSPFYNALVDYRNVADGDAPIFIEENSDLFFVDEIANGTQAIRRQRLANEGEIIIPTSMKAVRIYEELDRVLSGRVDFNALIAKVRDSYREKILNDIFKLWTSATYTDLGGRGFFPVAGSFDEDKLLDVMEYVEAAAGGKPVTLIGTKKALRMLKESAQAEISKEEFHKWGVPFTFYGAPVVEMPQKFIPGTLTPMFSDKIITVVAGDKKPIKFVYEGNPLIIPGNPINNADLTQEYFFGQKYGVGLAIAGGNNGIGRYEVL